MKLSIIIPYYNTKEYTDELLGVLDGQITKDVEVILIDDGSDEEYHPKYAWLEVIRTNNQGQSKARNLGINRSVGEYIQFIDSDDMVSEDFVSKILEKIPEGNDIIEFSWKSLNTSTFNFRLSEGNRSPMPGVVLRTFKRSYIGNMRFNEQKDAAEDEDFSRHLGYKFLPVSFSTIPDYLYFYRTEVEGSNVKQFKQGLKNTKRILYYYPTITADRKDILKDIMKDDETNEVILMTDRCDIPELKYFCQIMPPCRTWTHILKGEPYFNCEIIPVPLKSEIIIFINQLHIIGGIESFIYHFARLMQKHEIVLLVKNIPITQQIRYEKYIKVVQYSPRADYYCDTLIMLRILDQEPKNITYKRSVQMCHACRTNDSWHIGQSSDYIVNVSRASKNSFGYEAEEGIVIHNPIFNEQNKALILVSATRIPAPDKGNNEQRMRKLAEMLNDAEIPFVWFNFSEGQIPNPPRGMVNMGLEMDIQPYIKAADYLVQLSDSEGWSYSILEALTQNVPVLVCPFPSAYEMKIKDGKNGYIIPFDMNFDVHCLLNVPRFEYKYDNDKIREQWERIFKGYAKPKKKKGMQIRVIMTYNDIFFGRMMQPGEIVTMSLDRAKIIIDHGYGTEYFGKGVT